MNIHLALKEYHKALQINPNECNGAYSDMGVSFGSLGEYQEALVYFNKAKKEDPK